MILIGIGMANSSKMNWSYPDENERNWYSHFKSLVDSQDASGYASREDRSLFLIKGGTVTWNSGTSTLAWSAAIELISSIAGYHLDIAASSAVIADGQFMYVDITRSPTVNGTLLTKVANSVPNTDDAYVICVRRGTDVYFSNGMAIHNGGSGAVFSVFV